jgi:hypothetical protein
MNDMAGTSTPYEPRRRNGKARITGRGSTLARGGTNSATSHSHGNGTIGDTKAWANYVATRTSLKAVIVSAATFLRLLMVTPERSGSA